MCACVCVEGLVYVLPDYMFFCPFLSLGVNYLLFNYYTEPKWNSAMKAFYESLSVAEPDIVDVFRMKIQSHGSNMTAVSCKFNIQNYYYYYY